MEMILFKKGGKGEKSERFFRGVWQTNTKHFSEIFRTTLPPRPHRTLSSSLPRKRTCSYVRTYVRPCLERHRGNRKAPPPTSQRTQLVHLFSSAIDACEPSSLPSFPFPAADTGEKDLLFFLKKRKVGWGRPREGFTREPLVWKIKRGERIIANIFLDIFSWPH